MVHQGRRTRRDLPPVSKGTAGLLAEAGKLNDMQVAWKATLAGMPYKHNAWYGYAELCLFLGMEDEFLRPRRVTGPICHDGGPERGRADEPRVFDFSRDRQRTR